MISIKTSRVMRGIAMIIVLISHYAGWMYVTAHNEQLRLVLGSWGPAGVDIFFLMSGYGLAKSGASITGVKSGCKYLARRFASVYVPYLLLSGLIMVYSGEWKYITFGKVGEYVIGYNYWYICILLAAYIMFAIVWSLFKNDTVRGALLCLGIAAFSYILFRMGRSYFWYVSNMSIAIGIIAGTFDNRFADIKKEKVLAVKTGIFFVGMLGFAASSVLFNRIYSVNPLGGKAYRIAMNVFFAVMILGIAYLIDKKCNRKSEHSGVVGIIGEYSLYIYILHTVLFWIMIIRLDWLGYVYAVVIVAAISIVISVIVGMLMKKYITDRLVNRLR